MNDTKMAISASNNRCNHTTDDSSSSIKIVCSICNTEEYNNNSNRSLSLDTLSRSTIDDSSNFDDFSIDDIGNQDEIKVIETSVQLQDQCSTTGTLTTATDDSYVHSSSALLLLSSSSFNGLSEVAQDSFNLLMQQKQNTNDADDNDSVNNSDDDFYENDDDDDDDTFSYNSTDALMDPDDDDDTNHKDIYNRVRVHERIDWNENTESRRHVHFGSITVREYYCSNSDDNLVSINSIQDTEAASFVNMTTGRISSYMFENNNNIDCIAVCANDGTNNEKLNTTSLSDTAETTITSEVTFSTSNDYINYKRLMQGLAIRQQQQQQHQQETTTK